MVAAALTGGGVVVGAAVDEVLVGRLVLLVDEAEVTIGKSVSALHRKQTDLSNSPDAEFD